MNKNSTFLRLCMALLLIVFTSTMWAAPLSEADARRKASDFMKSRGQSATAHSKSIVVKETKLTIAETNKAFYVFNNNDGEGYVIVSADDRMPDVLGYSYTGTYNQEDIPDNMRGWLNGYVEQYEYLLQNEDVTLVASDPVSGDKVYPLLPTEWNQYYPYNNKCPKIDGETVPTGCVATAMAQIMYYYQWPKQTTKTIPGYTTSTNRIGMPSIDVTTIDWDKMMNAYRSDGKYSTEQVGAISTLFALCGTAIEMDYNPTGSGASTYNAMIALSEYFDYPSNSMSFVSRKDFQQSAWNQMIYDEIRNGRPVLYSGMSSTSGHAFVIDGYDQDDYFSVNWGWGGMQNGYFLLTALNGYNSGQGAVIGIESPEMVPEDRMYAYATYKDNTLTFHYDNKREERQGTLYASLAASQWHENASSITSVVFDDSFIDCKITSTAGWFSDCTNLTHINLNNLNTENVTSMFSMFFGCSSLTSLDVSNFNTSNVTDMRLMFKGCSSLVSLDVSNFNTSNVTDMRLMFEGCSSLVSLDVSNFNTSNVTDMGYMFSGCSALTGLDVSNFNTSNVRDMSSMFSGCSGLTSLDVSNFNTSNVTDMFAMFSGCSSLTSLDVSNFNTSNVTNLGSMFSGCSSLTSLALSNFNTSNVTDMNFMFAGCSSLTSLDVSKFNTSNVTSMHYMFSGCSGLTTIYAGRSWSTTSVTSGDYIFSGCRNLIGGKGTAYDFNKVGVYYARIDGGADAPGYFTDENATPYVKSEAYAVLSDNGKTVTFYYDTQKANRTGVVEINQRCIDTYNGGSNAYGTATTAIIDASFTDYRPTSTAYMFQECSKLTSVLGMEYLNTSNVKEMQGMFLGCISLISLDVSRFNTSNVTNMDWMFDSCRSITSLDLSNFNTSNVTSMEAMFSGCGSLTSLDMSNLSTSNVTSMLAMFNGCSSLTSLDVNNFNTSKVSNMSRMFDSCRSLTSLDVSNFKTSNVTNMIAMFENCSSLISLDVSNFNTSSVTNMGSMFAGCSSLTSLDVSKFNTSNVTSMNYMFSECSGLTTIYAGRSWSTISVTSGDYIFSGCRSLVGGKGTAYDFNKVGVYYARIDGGTDAPGYFTDENATPYVKLEAYAVLSDNGKIVTFYYDAQKAHRTGVVEINGSYNGGVNAYGTATTAVFDASFVNYRPTSMLYWFNQCTQLTSISGTENLNTSNVTNMCSMFAGCSSLTSLDVSKFNTSNVTSMNYMFSGCSGLTSLDVSNFNTSNVADMFAMFSGCSSLTSLDVSNFNTSNVVSMYYMFEGCSSLTSLDVSNFNTSNVTRMEGMFYGCSSLTSLDISSFNTSNVTEMSDMFAYCHSLKTIYAGVEWVTDAVTSGSRMFLFCNALVGGAGTVYDYVGAEYARIDGGTSAPGYFTDKNAKNKVALAAKSYTREYGEANPTFKYDVMEGTITDGTPELATEATATSPVGTYDIVISKGSISNSEVSLVNGTLTVTKAPLTISCGSYTIEQGEALPDFTLGYSGWKNDETEEVLTTKPTVTCEATKDSEPGTYDIIVSGAEAQNYEISYVAGKLTITARKDNVTLAAKNYTREYGETNPAFEYDVIEGTITDGTPEFTTKATATSPVGTYDIVISKGSVSNNEVSLVNGMLTVTKASLTISCGSYTIEQGEALPDFALEYSGWKNDETADVFITKPTVTCEATKDSEPGTYDIIVSGAEAQNYEIRYVAGKLTVTESIVDVTLTAKSYTRVYGEANPTFEYDVTAGTITSGTPEITCAATAASPVGTYDIVISKGTVGTNGTVNLVKGTLTITKAPLTIAAGDYTKEEGEDNPEFTPVFTGFKNNETRAVLTKQPVVTTTASKASRAGSYPITVNGAEAQNYSITYEKGTLTVTEPIVNVTLTAKSYTREYGEANPKFEYIVSDGNITSGTPIIICSATATSPVGTYDIVISKGTVGNNGTVNLVKGTLTITRAPLTIAAGNYTKEEGEDNPEFTPVFFGFKNNEKETVLTKQPVITTTATKASNVGNYPVSISGAEAQNYGITYENGSLIVTEKEAPKIDVTLTALSYTRVYGTSNPMFEYTVSDGTVTTGTPTITCSATATSPVGTYDIIISKGTVGNNGTVNLVNGTLTVTKAPLTITCGSYTIEQGEALPEFALEYSGWKNNETEDVLTTKPTVTCEATKDSEPGTYDIIVSGAEAQNYAISYVAGKLTVTARQDNVTLTAKSYTRVYGEANPAFEYDVTEGTITDGTPELSSEATATSPVGTYDIVISKGSVSNNEVSLVNGTLTITKAPLTISCGDYTIVQGEVLPDFTLEYNGWKNDETEDMLTTKPTVTCEASKDSEPGTYDIIVSGAEAQNYEISYVAGTLTIEAKPIVIEPMEVETEMKTEELSGQDLSNNVVNDVYYNTGENSYDSSDGSIVISQTTNFAQIADKEPGSKDVKENFNGMILKVAKGKGLITVNVKTSGNAQLVVQVGNGTPMLASKTEKGDVVFCYDVEEDTYVYIYAIIGSSAAKGYGLSAADTESSVRIYSITVSPGATDIKTVGNGSTVGDDIIYDLQGRRVDNPAKGIYIIGGRKFSVK